MTEEMRHHGILGQKWGVRRYQNKDGSLTPTGKKRANKLAAEYQKVTGKKITEGNQSQKKKTLKDLSDNELRDKVNRMRLEKDYLDVKKQSIILNTDLAKLNKKKASAGKRFLSTVANEIIKPAAINSGREIFQNWLKQTASKHMGDKKG